MLLNYIITIIHTFVDKRFEHHFISTQTQNEQVCALLLLLLLLRSNHPYHKTTVLLCNYHDNKSRSYEWLFPTWVTK